MTNAHIPSPGLHDVAERDRRLRPHAGTGLPTIAEAAHRVAHAEPAAPGDMAAGFPLFRVSAGGGRVLVVHTWRGGKLLREALLLPGDGAPPRRGPSALPSLGTTDDVPLLAHEAAARARPHGSAEAHLAEVIS